MKRNDVLSLAMGIYVIAAGSLRFGGQGVSAAQQHVPQIEVGVSAHHDASPPLRTIPPKAAAAPRHIHDVLPIPHAAQPEFPDPALQTSVTPFVATTPG